MLAWLSPGLGLRHNDKSKSFSQPFLVSVAGVHLCELEKLSGKPGFLKRGDKYNIVYYYMPRK